MDPSGFALGDFFSNDSWDGNHHGRLLGVCNFKFWRLLELGSGGKRRLCSLADFGGIDPYHDHFQEKRNCSENLDRSGNPKLYPGSLCNFPGEIGCFG